MLASFVVMAITIAAQGTSPPADDGAVSSPPAATTPSEATVPPPPPPPPPPVAVAPVATPAPDAKPQGMEAGGTAAAQMGAGVAGCCVGGCISVPCAFVPFVGGFLGNIVTGLVIGGTETVVGDAVGQKRAAMIWPMLASTGILVVGGLVNIGVSVAFGLSTAALDPTNLTNLGAFGVGAAVSAGVSLGTLLAAIVVPALVYQFTGVDKEPGDTGGFGMPGIVSPADPTGTRATRTAAPSSASTPSSTEPPPPTAPAIGY